MKSLIAVLVLMFSTMALCAQQDEAAAPVRVARLSYFSGAVRVERADNTGDPDGQPVLNMPIGDQTRVTVSDYAQAELEFEDGSVVRITPRSTLLVESLTLEGGCSAVATYPAEWPGLPGTAEEPRIRLCCQRGWGDDVAD